MSEIETHGRESKRKPSVEMNMHGGAKNRNWLFTGRVSELTYPLNALPLHGSAIFGNRQLTVGAPLDCGAAELRTSWKCGAADLMKMQTCGAADLRTSVGKKLKIFQSVKIEILASGFCPLSFQSYVWMFALEFFYHFNDLCCLWKT